MIEDCKGVGKSINEVVLVPELAALLQSFACLVAFAGSTDCYTCSVQNTTCISMRSVARK